MTVNSSHPRTATGDDARQLLRLWAMLFEQDDSSVHRPWMMHASEWFDRLVDDVSSARLPVIELDGSIVATAIGTLEIGVPNPHCPKGRTVRLANVITLPQYRGRGYGTRLVLDVIDWARAIKADRVDLSATPGGTAPLREGRIHPDLRSEDETRLVTDRADRPTWGLGGRPVRRSSCGPMSWL